MNDQTNNNTQKTTVNIDTSKKEENTTTDRLRIDLSSPEPFGNDGGIKTMLLTSKDICEKISAIFGEVFTDYVGAKIKINNGINKFISKYLNKDSYNAANNIGVPYVELYFKDFPEDKSRGIKAIRPISSPNEKNNDIIRGVVNLTESKSALAYYPTDELFEVLTDFIKPINPNMNIVRSELYSEVQEDMNRYGNNRELLGCIAPVSLRAIIEKIYGTDIRDDHDKLIKKYQYSIKIVNSIMHNNNSGIEASYIFSIDQLDYALINKLSRDLGLIRETNRYYPYR